MLNPTPVLKSLVMQRISQAPVATVWTPVDFLDLGSREGVDKALQRLVASDKLRRVERGLYDCPRVNPLTGQVSVPDYRNVIDAVGRRDQVRLLIDGLAAANELGLTKTLPGQIVVHTDGRLRPIRLGNLTLQFKLTAPSKLYWSGRPAMQVVQSLYWLRDGLKHDAQIDQDAIQAKLIRLLQDSRQGGAIRADLRSGLHTMPSWMQRWIREMVTRSEHPAAVRHG